MNVQCMMNTIFKYISFIFQRGKSQQVQRADIIYINEGKIQDVKALYAQVIK